MDKLKIMKIFEDTAYIRTSGTLEERKTAQYLASLCEKLGIGKAYFQEFTVDKCTMHEAKLFIDDEEIVCKGYLNCGNADLKAPLYYLRGNDKMALSKAKDTIVFVDGPMTYWLYKDLLENGALGFITYDGNVNYQDCDIDQKELRSYIYKDEVKMPCVNINAKEALRIIKKGFKTAHIVLNQDLDETTSQNVIVDLKGETDEFIAFTAHYDSTSLSKGAYDNMSGAIGLLGIAEYFAKNPHKYSMRFIFCGSEERGLLGSKFYCENEENLKNCIFNINLDMIGCAMGKFISVATAEEKLCDYVSYFGLEKGFSLSTKQDVYSSDSTPFADKGVPAITFARSAPMNIATIHNRYDTIEVMSGEQMIEDINFLIAFTDRMANAVYFPVAQEIPQNMKDKLDIYLLRKRG